MNAGQEPTGVSPRDAALDGSRADATVDLAYPGGELELFAEARNWKRYYRRFLRPLIGGRVLEVGAGIGATSRWLCEPERAVEWTALEPDSRLRQALQQNLSADPLPVPAQILAGTTADLPAQPTYDTVLYIDVIEHILDDAAELHRAAGLLRPGGRIVVLVPAHQGLYSPFDRAIGHFRRYSVRRLRKIAPPATRVRTAFYLDSVGMLASAANRCLLKSSMPTRAQIRFWDTVLVRLSSWLDPCFGYRLGKTAVAIYERTEP